MQMPLLFVNRLGDVLHTLVTAETTGLSFNYTASLLSFAYTDLGTQVSQQSYRSQIVSIYFT